ncbi:MAG: hypothetical protein CVU05_03960 [Bacteroidetes bacterium HGW-Bacteroidetes-21]|jgi:hypothetical protein|nr:MAG: hypothetical protein CVU05_03960 [Bacteroidetes bacterium HGW-Bacteroidetes-21]
MRKLIFLTLIATTVSCAYSQKLKDNEVPALVKNKLTSVYPNLSDVKWEMEDGKYEAEFDVNKVETSVVIDATGNLLETETEIEPSALPQTIQTYCAQNVPGKKIKEAAKIVDAAGKISYEAEIDKADYLFDSAGNFIKKEVEQEKDKED